MFTGEKRRAHCGQEQRYLWIKKIAQQPSHECPPGTRFQTIRRPPPDLPSRKCGPDQALRQPDQINRRHPLQHQPQHRKSLESHRHPHHCNRRVNRQTARDSKNHFCPRLRPFAKRRPGQQQHIRPRAELAQHDHPGQHPQIIRCHHHFAAPAFNTSAPTCATQDPPKGETESGGQ